MTDWAPLIKVTIALFAIVNPIGSLPIFISATDGWNRRDRARTAKTVAISVFPIPLLNNLGCSYPIHLHSFLSPLR